MNSRFEVVPFDRIIDHPHNANVVPPETMEKLSRHIALTGRTPALLVRTLESSKAFAEAHRAGQVQLLDGHHRRRILRDQGHQGWECVIWSGVTDEQAEMYLATLNELGGEPDTDLKIELIRRIGESMDRDAARLAELLPDPHEVIAKLLDAASGLDSPTEGGGPLAGGEFEAQNLTILCLIEQRDEIRAAIRAWLERNDPDRTLPMREGAALAAICADWANGA